MRRRLVFDEEDDDNDDAGGAATIVKIDESRDENPSIDDDLWIETYNGTQSSSQEDGWIKAVIM